MTEDDLRLAVELDHQPVMVDGDHRIRSRIEGDRSPRLGRFYAFSSVVGHRVQSEATDSTQRLQPQIGVLLSRSLT